MKRYLMSLAIRERQVTFSYHFTVTSMAKIKETVISVGEDVEKLEAACIAGGSTKWCNIFEKQSSSISGSKTELL